ncbi:MAG: pyridoxal phosphate-dependent aminotransferase family protein [Fimbriimonadaceae bacterium]|nr:pyridoxal phosphate-dependent aminotransferase family protein [Chitinophagales bacterium]
MSDLSKIDNRLLNDIQKRIDSNSLRTLKTGNSLIDFCSNDYLGFAQDEELKEQIISEIKKLRRIGSTGSRLLTGNHSLTEKLEKNIALFHDAESALFFNSGYEANSGLISTITKRNNTILYDELSHASLREGIRLSNAESFSFKHNDLSDLENKLQKISEEKFIIIESAYSMDGDICPLKEIVELAEKYSANIILDEAHATGVIGKNGEGLAHKLNLHKRIFARVHTFGKAIGNNGAVILGSEILKNYLINFCRPFIYTTAPNLMQVIAVDLAYKKLENSEQHISRLHVLCDYFKNTISKYKHVRLLPSDSAIFSIIIPGNEEVKLAATYCQNAGYDVRPILSPTVASGSERLRVCMHTFNSENEIKRLCKLIESITEFIERDKANVL